MGVTGLLPFLQKASRPAKMKEFAGLNFFFVDFIHPVTLLQGQPLLLTSMSGFTRVPSGAILLYSNVSQSFQFLIQPTLCIVALRLWHRVDQLMPT